MRRFAALGALALVVSACASSGSSDATGATSSTAATTVPDTTTTVGPGTTAPEPTSSTTARERPEGDAAPDFTLALGEGGEFTLSDEQKPVFMVFWAEW